MLIWFLFWFVLILQARILEWVAISFSRGSSQPRDQTLVSCIAGRFFTIWAIREANQNDCYCSVVKLCPTLCDPHGLQHARLPVLHYLPKFAQTHVHWVGDAFQPSHPLPSSSLAFNLAQHQGLFQWVGSSHQVTKISELQIHHQSFQWIVRVIPFRID